MRAMAIQTTGVSIACSTICYGAGKKIKSPRHWPLWRESASDRWIPFTKGQNAENASIDDVIMNVPRDHAQPFFPGTPDGCV